MHNMRAMLILSAASRHADAHRGGVLIMAPYSKDDTHNSVLAQVKEMLCECVRVRKEWEG